jgi:hypothetical protein
VEQSAFLWSQHPAAENLLMNWLADFCQLSPEIGGLHHELATLTSTRLFDWIDHFVVPPSEEEKLKEVGYVLEERSRDYTSLRHPGAQLPRVVLAPEIGLAVKVEMISDFLMVRGWARIIEGSPYSSYRRCHIGKEEGVNLWVVERRASRTLEPMETSDSAMRFLQCREAWKARPRDLLDEEVAMQAALKISDHMIKSVGQHMTAWIVCEVERAYWQSRNRAGQWQKGRQDHLGMGWANHDHHTFRSSRHLFPMLVALFEKMGFQCRERFYAGEEAGWGAQVMENPVNGLVLFLDLDLAPGEVAIDFAHEMLDDLPKPGTVGLWCGLHGDSILQGGMHHLEAQFLFENMRDELESSGHGMMEPFSDMHHLHQAFSRGEQWSVSLERIDRLLELGWISPEEAQKFRANGAIGSHLENLQRREGYKGFNQKNVSHIIQRTDPRMEGL